MSQFLPKIVELVKVNFISSTDHCYHRRLPSSPGPPVLLPRRHHQLAPLPFTANAAVEHQSGSSSRHWLFGKPAWRPALEARGRRTFAGAIVAAAGVAARAVADSEAAAGGCCIAEVRGTVSRAMTDSGAYPSLAAGWESYSHLKESWWPITALATAKPCVDQSQASAAATAIATWLTERTGRCSVSTSRPFG